MSLNVLIQGRPNELAGLPIQRVLPFAKKREVGPFVFLDRMGPQSFSAGQGVDILPHPHIGLSTLTYLFEGQFLHQDSLGSYQVIQPGEVNWMTSGKGIVHSERSPQEIRSSNFNLNGIQMWIALPKDQEDCEPYFQHYKEETIPKFSVGGVQTNLILGEYQEHQSPIPTPSPTYLLNLQFSKNSYFKWPSLPMEFAVYIISGRLQFEDQTFEENSLAVFHPNSEISLQALDNCHALFFGGAPFPEPRRMFWNFVSTSQEKIDSAKKLWTEGKFPVIPTDTDYLSLPE